MQMNVSLGMQIDYEILETHDIELGAASRVLSYWNAARGGRFAPAWQRDFSLMGLPLDLIPCMTVIDRVDGGQTYFYRFWGTRHVSMKGFEMTGKTVEQTPNKAIQRIATRQLEAVVQRRRPTVFLYKIDYPARHRAAEFVLRLPLSDDGETVNRIVTFQDLDNAEMEWEVVMRNVWPDGRRGDTA